MTGTDAAERPRAALWDLDGTLADSEEYHWRSWRDVLRGEGHDITRQQFLDNVGQKNDRILARWLGDGLDSASLVRIGDAKEALYREFARREGLVPLPGALEWIAKLRRAGWRQAIASSAPRANVDAMLRALKIETEFDAIIAAEDVSAGKPDPQVFLKAAAALGAAPGRSVVVEDAPAGIEAARRAGMRSIGVNRATVLAADVYVRSLVDLPEDAFEVIFDVGGR